MEQKQIKIKELRTAADLRASQVGDLVNILSGFPEPKPGVVVERANSVRIVAYMTNDKEIKTIGYVPVFDNGIQPALFQTSHSGSKSFGDYDRMLKGVGQ